MNLERHETITGRCAIIYPDGHGHCTSVSLNAEGKAVSAFSNSCDGIRFCPAIVEARLKNYEQERIDLIWQQRWDAISHFEINGERVEKEV